MDKRLSEAELQQRLSDAGNQVETGALYKHYKGKFYVAIDMAILESTNEVCVIYRAQYGQQLTLIRPVSEWVEAVEVNGVQHKRFAKV